MVILTHFPQLRLAQNMTKLAGKIIR